MGKESVQARKVQLEEWLKTTKNYKSKQKNARRVQNNSRKVRW